MNKALLNEDIIYLKKELIEARFKAAKALSEAKRAEKSLGPFRNTTFKIKHLVLFFVNDVHSF